jgi:hypothetical protein
MKKHTTSTAIPTHALKAEALASLSASFERFCLASGLETLSEMMEQDATAACGGRMSGASSAKRTAGGGRKARSAFTAARSRLSARAFVGSTAPSAFCRVGRALSARTCSANGR